MSKLSRGWVDPLLAHARDPREPFMPDQRAAYLLRATAQEPPGAARLVQLACGHFVYTKAAHWAVCPRCGEMIRGGYDHDAFRYRGARDTFHWPGDPLLALHEAAR